MSRLRINTLKFDGVTSDGTREAGEIFFRSDLGVPRLAGYGGDILRLGRIDNFSATTDPGVGDDVNDGYAIGSFWVNTTASRIWTAQSVAAGAADWQLVSRDTFSTTTTGEQSVTSDTNIALESLTVGIAGDYLLEFSANLRGDGGEIPIFAFTDSSLVSLESNHDGRAWIEQSVWDFSVAMSLEATLTANQAIRVAARELSGTEVWFDDRTFKATLLRT